MPSHGKKHGKAKTHRKVRSHFKAQLSSKITNSRGNIQRPCQSNNNGNENKNERRKERETKYRHRKSKEKPKVINLNNNTIETPAQTQGAKVSRSLTKSANELLNPQPIEGDKSTSDIKSIAPKNEDSKTSKLSKSQTPKKLTNITNSEGHSDLLRSSENVSKASSISVSADNKDKSKTDIESSAAEQKDKESAGPSKSEASVQSAALSKPETSVQSAALPKPETSVQSAALPKPETSVQSAALSKPETSVQSAALSKGEASVQSVALSKQEVSDQSAALSKPEASLKSTATPSAKGSKSSKEKFSNKLVQDQRSVSDIKSVTDKSTAGPDTQADKKEKDPLAEKSNVQPKLSAGKGEKKMRNYGDKYDIAANYHQIMLTEITQDLIDAKCLSKSLDFSKEVDNAQHRCIMCDKTICDVDLKNKETGKCMYCDPSIKREKIPVAKTKEKLQISSEYRNNAVCCKDDSECRCKTNTTFQHSPSFLKYQESKRKDEKPPMTPTEMLRASKSKHQPMKPPPRSFTPIDIASINKQIESMRRPIDTAEISAKIELSRSIHKSISPTIGTSQSFKSSGPPSYNRMSKSFKSSVTPVDMKEQSSRSIRQTMSPSYITSKSASIRQSMQTKRSNLKPSNVSARIGTSPYSSANNSSNSRMLYADVLMNKSTNSATDYYSMAEKLDDPVLSPNSYVRANLNPENLTDYVKINRFANESRLEDAGHWSRTDILKSNGPKMSYKQNLYPSTFEGRTKSQNYQSVLESQLYKGVHQSPKFRSPKEKKSTGILKNKQYPTVSNYLKISDTNCSNQSNSNLLMGMASKSNSIGDMPINSFVSPDDSIYQPQIHANRNDSFGAMLSPEYLRGDTFERPESLPDFGMPTNYFHKYSPSLKNQKDKIKLVRYPKTLDENRLRNFNNLYKGQKIYPSDFNETRQTPVTNFKKNATHYNGCFAATANTFCDENLFRHRNSRVDDGLNSSRLSNFNMSSACTCGSDFEKQIKLTPSNELINITTNFTSVNDLQILNKLKINTCPNNIYNVNF